MHATRRTSRNARRIGGFTLIELLVVVAILAVLISILLPTLGRAKDVARATLCKTNLAGLARANMMYADDNGAHYVPAASDILSSTSPNLHRWHGTRPNPSAAYDPQAGPMAKYLGQGGKIKKCPTFRDFRTEAKVNAYESGSGGYGYSDLYIGSEFLDKGFYLDSPGQLSGCKEEAVRNPGETVMFTDAAMCQGKGVGYYTEESFSMSYYGLGSDGKLDTGRTRDPSIHFRHNGSANVAWADGHATGRDDFFSKRQNVYGADAQAMKVGWFGPKDNSLFDLQ